MATYSPGTHTVGPGQWPYPDGSEAPFGPGNFQDLATRANLIAGAGIGYEAASTGLETRVANGDAYPSMMVYTLDTDIIWQYNGATWVPVPRGYFAYQSTTTGSASNNTETTMPGAVYGGAHPAVVAASANNLTATVAGWYRVTGQIQWQTNGSGQRSMRALKNGNAPAIPVASIVTVPTNGVAPQSASGVVQCAAGDVWNLVVSQTSGSTLSFSAQLTLEFVASS